MKFITSVQNPRVKNAIKLRGRRARIRQSLTLIDGTRELAQAIAGRIEIVEAFVCPDMCGEAALNLVEQLRGQAELLQVTRPVFDKLTFGDRHEGLVAVARIPRCELSDWIPPPCPLIAVLECLEKPGNVGAVLRSADGAAISAVIVADGGTDLFNPNAIRASLGTIFTVPLFSARSQECLDWLKHNNIAVYAARVGARRRYTEADFRSSAALVFGSEYKGLSPIWQSAEVTPVAVPMCGAADSLNVSATAAILFYEALRQRSQAGTAGQSG